MVENQEITLSSNWNTLGDSDLLSILIKDSSDDAGINLDDMTADNCVCLIRDDNRERHKAYLEIKVHGYIKSINLMSEAQVIEVFGVNDEYLSTHNSEFFDDWEELAVYYSKISLPNIPVCKLEFTRTRNDDRVWVYGAKICLQTKTNHHPPIPINFNLEQINRLLGNSKFSNLARYNYLKNLPNSNLCYLLGKTTVPDIHMNTSNKENSQESVVTDLLSRLLVAPDSVELQRKCSNEIPNESSSSNWLTAYIDRKCNEIKTDILHEVDVKINNLKEEANEKLDKIICLLEGRALAQ